MMKRYQILLPLGILVVVFAAAWTGGTASSLPAQAATATVMATQEPSATVTAVTRTSLLALDAHDLHVLMDREPRIAEHILEVARSRLGREITPKGDLVAEELEEADTVEQSTPGRGDS